MLPHRSFFSLRSLHIAISFGLLCFVTWGLLTPDPLSVVRNTRLGFVQTLNDILIHLTVYTVFSTTCLSLLRRRTDLWVRNTVFGLLLVHGIGTELLQTMLPMRTGDPLDAIANVTGIAAGAVLVARTFHRTAERSPAHG